MAKEKKAPKLTKTGKPRKGLPQGLDRIMLFTGKTMSSMAKLTERVQKWSEKAKDSVARDRLATMAHLLTEAHNAIETASTKASALRDSGWSPPKGAVAKVEDFAEGERVMIRAEYRDTYSALDKRALDTMKVLKEVKQGKRTNYLVTGAGFVPKSHLEAFAE